MGFDWGFLFAVDLAPIHDAEGGSQRLAEAAGEGWGKNLRSDRILLAPHRPCLSSHFRVLV